MHWSILINYISFIEMRMYLELQINTAYKGLVIDFCNLEYLGMQIKECLEEMEDN